MTKQEEQKLDLEIRKLLQELDRNPRAFKIDVYRTMLLTVAVTTAVVTAYFKFIGA